MRPSLIGVDGAAIGAALKLRTGEARQYAMGIAAVNKADGVAIKVTENLANDPLHADKLAAMKKKLKRFQKQTQDPWIMKWEYE